jgi:hypothetical protein
MPELRFSRSSLLLVGPWLTAGARMMTLLFSKYVARLHYHITFTPDLTITPPNGSGQVHSQAEPPAEAGPTDDGPQVELVLGRKAAARAAKRIKVGAGHLTALPHRVPCCSLTMPWHL